jgi:hypothetical protein
MAIDDDTMKLFWGTTYGLDKTGYKWGFCVYDQRSPLYDEEDQIPDEWKRRCSCDQCYYGMHDLACEIERLETVVARQLNLIERAVAFLEFLPSRYVGADSHMPIEYSPDGVLTELRSHLATSKEGE